jgi:glycogen operon protein
MPESLDHTHTHGEFRLRYGHPLPFGASHVPGGVNFSVFSSNATSCSLVLFERGEATPFAEIPFPPEYRLGNVWAMTVFDLNYAQIEYGYRFDGLHDPHQGNHFDPQKILLDPKAREISGRNVWKQPSKEGEIYPFRGRIPFYQFDWEHTRPLKRAESEMVVYELHVRGFTAHTSAGVNLRELSTAAKKNDYLRDLGVNSVELMPIFEFDELENRRTNPLTGEELCNYWGYSTLGFLAPKAAFAATGRLGAQVHELKQLIKSLHEADIEVILDVVFNHTAEGGSDGPTISFRGIDNKTYYMLDSHGQYLNYTSCGNTVNCNHPVVRGFVLSCLRYWAAEFHVDGFRFDLASVLGRDSHGAPLANPPPA